MIPDRDHWSPLPRGWHFRQLLRHAVCRLLAESPQSAALLAGRIWPNRFEHWLSPDLPAAGVYTLAEENLDARQSPDPDERRLSLTLELVAVADERLDDRLDELCVAAEKALFSDFAIDRLGQAMTAIAEQRLGLRFPRNKSGRSPVDTLLLIRLDRTELGISTDGAREAGMASLFFDVEYFRRLPPPFDTLDINGRPFPPFLHAWSGWDVEEADGRLDMESSQHFEPEQDPENVS